jgi:hypothetical protein
VESVDNRKILNGLIRMLLSLPRAHVKNSSAHAITLLTCVKLSPCYEPLLEFLYFCFFYLDFSILLDFHCTGCHSITGEQMR